MKFGDDPQRGLTKLEIKQIHIKGTKYEQNVKIDSRIFSQQRTFEYIRITLTAKNMREYGFSLTRILPYKDRNYDSVLIRENKGQ